jgi:hypothetical protein
MLGSAVRLSRPQITLSRIQTPANLQPWILAYLRAQSLRMLFHPYLKTAIGRVSGHQILYDGQCRMR